MIDLIYDLIWSYTIWTGANQACHASTCVSRPSAPKAPAQQVRQKSSSHPWGISSWDIEKNMKDIELVCSCGVKNLKITSHLHICGIACRLGSICSMRIWWNSIYTLWLAVVVCGGFMEPNQLRQLRAGVVFQLKQVRRSVFWRGQQLEAYGLVILWSANGSNDVLRLIWSQPWRSDDEQTSLTSRSSEDSNRSVSNQFARYFHVSSTGNLSPCLSALLSAVKPNQI